MVSSMPMKDVKHLGDDKMRCLRNGGREREFGTLSDKVFEACVARFVE